MEELLFWLYAVVVVGSLCGLRAALRLGALTHRIAALEQRLLLGEAPRAPALSAPAVAAALPAPPAPVLAPALPAPPPPPRSPEPDWWHGFELRAGTRWITWLGAGALVIAAALFVKLAIDLGWLGPAARLALGGAGGVGLLLAGRRAHRAEMRPLAHGLFGAGLGVLYVATYVAFASYGLIARELVLAAMIAVTITGGAIAIRHDAQPVAVLALLGGLVTPIAVSSGGGARGALLPYLLVLALGAVAIALARRWRAVELIALAGTWALFGAHLVHARAPGGPAELAWLAAFHVVFAALPFGFHLLRRRSVDPGRLFAAFVNAAAALACAAEILGHHRALGAAALGMAVIYAALDAVARRGLAAGDREQLGFVTFAAVLAALAAPLLLRGHAVTVAWSIEAVALLALGFHDRRASIRLGALGVLALAMLHAARSYEPSHAAGLRPFADPAFAGALIAPLAAGLFAWIHGALERRGDGRDRWYGAAAEVAAIAGLGVAIGAEAYLHHGGALDPLAHAGRRAHTALSIAWSSYAALLLAVGFWRRRRRFRLAGLGLLGTVAAKLLLIDLAGAPQAHRVLSFLIAGALMIAVSYAYHRLERRPGPPEA